MESTSRSRILLKTGRIFHNDKGTIYQEEIIVLNVYTPK